MSSEFRVKISGRPLSLFLFGRGRFCLFFSPAPPPNLLSSFSWLYGYFYFGLFFGPWKNGMMWGREVIFPANPDLVDILGDMDLGPSSKGTATARTWAGLLEKHITNKAS